MRDDKDLLAALIGALFTIVPEIITQLFVVLRITKYSIFTLASMIITLNRPAWIIGLFVTPIVGGLVAVILYHIFSITNSKHLIVKCIGVGIFMWIGLEFIFTTTIEDKLINIRPLSSYYGHLIGAIIYGLGEGILFKKYLFHDIKQS